MWSKKNFGLGRNFWKMLKYFNNFEHPDIWSNLGGNCLVSFRDSNKKRIYGTRNNKKRFMTVPLCCNISTILSIIISNQILRKTIWIVSETRIRNEEVEQETIRSVLWSVLFCFNISTILSIQVSDWILKKTVWLVSETQIRNEYMEQETIRRVLWSVPFVVICQQFWASKYLHDISTSCFLYTFREK